MERVWKIGFAFLSLLAVVPAGAGVLLVPPDQEPAATKPSELYQDSRFGRPPAPMRTGIDAGYAGRAVSEMEDEEDPGHPMVGSRKPAGLVFGNVATKPSRRSITEVNERSSQLPRSPVNGSIQIPEDATVFRKGVQEVAIIAHDLGYFPKAIFVTRDVPVRLFVTGASKSTLCIMMDSFGVRKQIKSQKIEEITFTPSTPGKYRFYCPVNGMEGTMIVKELVTTSPPPEADSASVSEPAPAAASVPATASLADPSIKKN